VLIFVNSGHNLTNDQKIAKIQALYSDNTSGGRKYIIGSYGDHVGINSLAATTKFHCFRNQLPVLLGTFFVDRYYGILSSYLYFCTFGTEFPAHEENENLASISVLHRGKPKVW